MMAEFSLTMEQAMDMPYALCRIMLAVNAERHGAGQCWWVETEEHQQRKQYLMELAGVRAEANN